MNRTEEIYPGVKIPAYVENFFKPSIAEKYGFYADEVEKTLFILTVSLWKSFPARFTQPIS